MTDLRADNLFTTLVILGTPLSALQKNVLSVESPPLLEHKLLDHRNGISYWASLPGEPHCFVVAVQPKKKKKQQKCLENKDQTY